MGDLLESEKGLCLNKEGFYESRYIINRRKKGETCSVPKESFYVRKEVVPGKMCANEAMRRGWHKRRGERPNT